MLYRIYAKVLFLKNYDYQTHCVVALDGSVCLSIGYTGELCQHGWTDRDATWGHTVVGPRNLVQIPADRGSFIEFRPWHQIRISAIKVSAISGLYKNECAAAMLPFANLLWTLVEKQWSILSSQCYRHPNQRRLQAYSTVIAPVFRRMVTSEVIVIVNLVFVASILIGVVAIYFFRPESNW